MKRHHATLSVGLLVAATACGDILGIDDNAELVECNADDNCTDRARPKCSAHKCVALGGTSGNAGTSHGGSGGLFATTGGAAGSGGSGIVSVSGGTGGVSSTTGGLAGTTASDGGADASGGTSDTVPIGGTQNFGGGVGTAGSTMVVGGSGAIASYGGALPSGGTGGTSGATTSVAGTTQGGAGGHIVTGGTAGIAAAGTGAVGNNGGVSGGGTGGVAGVAGVVGVAGFGGDCPAGAHRCLAFGNEGNTVAWQTCDALGHWGGDVQCPGHCTEHENGCAVAPSCEGISDCAATTRSCCNSLPLPGETFDRSQIEDEDGNIYCDTSSRCPATLSPFLLDTYEVTVARFRKFVRAYPKSIPGKGAGKNSHNGSDDGWNDSWNSLLPIDQTALVQLLQSCSNYTYTEQSAGTDFKPMNCVDWYLAFAFCAWDGGRLPTEAEWTYAATGGEARHFPWSVPPYASSPLTPDYATYNDTINNWTGPQEVARAYRGVSRWGQFDMAGNVYEWLVDEYGIPYPDVTTCVDCANLAWSTSSVRVIRGGGYSSSQMGLATDFRSAVGIGSRWSWLGFRCARNLTLSTADPKR